MVKLLFALTLLQCIFLIGLEFILLLFFNLETYEPLRHYFINQGWGDVYTFTGHFYNIPVKGNALLPFVYMLSYFIPVFPQKRKSFFRCIYLLAIVFAGNFAYLISLFVFHFIYGCYFSRQLEIVYGFITRKSNHLPRPFSNLLQKLLNYSYGFCIYSYPNKLLD